MLVTPYFQGHRCGVVLFEPLLQGSHVGRRLLADGENDVVLFQSGQSPFAVGCHILHQYPLAVLQAGGRLFSQGFDVFHPASAQFGQRVAGGGGGCLQLREGRLFGHGFQLWKRNAELVHGEVPEADAECRRAFCHAVVAAGRIDKLRVARNGIGVASVLAEAQAAVVLGQVEVGIHQFSPCPVGRYADVHAYFLVGIVENVVCEDVLAVGVPYVRMQRIVDNDVVGNDAVVAFAQFESAAEQEVVVDAVVAGTVVEVDVPSVVAAPAVVAENGGSENVEVGQAGRAFHFAAGGPDVGRPVTVASPGVEAAVVAGFEHGVEHVAEFYYVSSVAAFADIDAGPRHVEDRGVGHGDVVGHGNLHGSRLFLYAAGAGDDAFFHAAVGRIVVVFGAGRAVERAVVLRTVAEQRTAQVGRVADEGHAIGPAVVDVTAVDFGTAVVAVDEDGISAHLVELTVAHGAVVRSLHDDTGSAVDGPVAAQERFAVFHEGARGVTEDEALPADVFDGALTAAAHFHQVLETYSFDGGFLHGLSFFGVIVEALCFGVVEPFSGLVQFLEYVFHDTVNAMHGRGAVVLPSAFELQVALFVFPLDYPVHVAPQCGVHGVHVGTGRLFPALRTPGEEKVGGRVGAGGMGKVPGVKHVFAGHNVRVARHGAAHTVDIELVEAVGGLFHLCAPNAVAPLFPAELERHAAAENGLAGMLCAVDHGMFGCARHFGCHTDGLRQIVCAVHEEEVHGVAAVVAGGEALGGFNRAHRCCGSSGIAVGSLRGDVDFKRVLQGVCGQA